MRILCLDIGTKRIGIAASDPMGWTAQPVSVIERHRDGREMDEIAKLCEEMEVKKLIVGMPLDSEGGVGGQGKKVESYVNHLKRHLAGCGLDIPLELWDERYSTAVARERLIDADVSRAKRKRVIDKMAAVVILESYLRENEAPEIGEGMEG